MSASCATLDPHTSGQFMKRIRPIAAEWQCAKSMDHSASASKEKVGANHEQYLAWFTHWNVTGTTYVIMVRSMNSYPQKLSTGLWTNQNTALTSTYTETLDRSVYAGAYKPREF